MSSVYELIQQAEDELIELCERMGYGLDINYLRGKVTVNTGSGKKRDDHVFASVTTALIWCEAQERSIKKVGK